MPTSDAFNKSDRLRELELLFLKQPGRQFRTSEIATLLGVSEKTALRYLESVSRVGRLPVDKGGTQFWKLMPDAKLSLPPLHLTIPEASVFFIAARLLSQIHDEPNRYVIEALVKLIQILPPELVESQHQLVELARERQAYTASQGDRSAIFEALTMGWISRCEVRIIYDLPHGRTFECKFAPYLLEPSGIGRTIYAIGLSTPPNEIRTFKFERIQYAELLKHEPFRIPEDFDGRARLKRAWGVMYGDEDAEATTVKLRFSKWVEKRVNETLWHPSQEIVSVPDGCEMTIQVGDMVEVENWIRGWGSDCEVLEPLELRERTIGHVQRLAAMYGVLASPATSLDEPDNELFDTFFGE